MKPHLVLFAMMVLVQTARANVVGNGNQNFNPTPDGLDFVTVQSSETLKPGIFNFGIFLNHAVNTLPYFNTTSQSITRYNDSLTAMDLSMGVGVFKNFQLGLSLPFVIAQTVSSDNVLHGEFITPGNIGVRLAAKYRMSGDDEGGTAVVLSTDIDRLNHNPYTGNDPKPILNFELVGDTTIKKWALGANVGYRQVNAGSPVNGAPVEPISNQYIASLAASYHMEKIDSKLIFEIYGSQPAKDTGINPNRAATSLEGLAGIKHDLKHNLALHGGLATELQHGVSSPDWRVYVGMNYTIGPVFNKPKPFQAIGEDKFVMAAVLFDFDSDQMVGDFDGSLTILADEIRKRPFKKVVVTGFTDSIGSDTYNQSLSQKRATAIKNYFIQKKNFTEAQLEAVGKGKLDPVADNGNFQGRQQNRRVEFQILR